MGNYDHRGWDPRRTPQNDFFEPLQLSPGFVRDYDNLSWYRRSPREGRKVAQDSRLRQQSFGRKKLEEKSLVKATGKPEKDAMALGKSLRKLNRRINVSEEFYNNFLSDYDNDVDRIKKYCPKSVLNSMWGFKVRGEKQEDEEQDNGVEDATEKFELHRIQATQALKDVLSSSTKDFKGSRLASAERLKEKIYTYKGQISKLLELAPKGRTHCEALLGEFKELKEIISPSSDKNKDIFASVGSEEDGGGFGDEVAYSD